LQSRDAGLSNGANTPKSFIQQRVERLYGRGALAQGFFKQTKLNGNNVSTTVHHNLNKKSFNCRPIGANHFTSVGIYFFVGTQYLIV
jgi:hypothetical protein